MVTHVVQAQNAGIWFDCAACGSMAEAFWREQDLLHDDSAWMLPSTAIERRRTRIVPVEQSNCRDAYLNPIPA